MDAFGIGRISSQGILAHKALALLFIGGILISHDSLRHCIIHSFLIFYLIDNSKNSQVFVRFADVPEALAERTVHIFSKSFGGERYQIVFQKNFSAMKKKIIKDVGKYIIERFQLLFRYVFLHRTPPFVNCCLNR